MKLLIAALALIVSYSSLAAAGGVALRTSEKNDVFAKCAAQEVLKPGNTFTFKKLFFAGMDEYQGAQKFAYIYFDATTQNGSEIRFKLLFQTVDANGWQLIQGVDGEIYPFSNEIKPRALLVERQSGSVLGSRDISGCLK